MRGQRRVHEGITQPSEHLKRDNSTGMYQYNVHKIRGQISQENSRMVKTKYCRFHRSHDHDTKDYIQHKDVIDRIVTLEGFFHCLLTVTGLYRELMGNTRRIFSQYMRGNL
jgi:hypothetical protein